MPLSPEQIEKAIQEIDRLANPASPRYGRLLQWQNFPNPAWHYGIGLSDTHIFDTGGILQPFTKHDAQQVLGIDSIAFAPDQTIQRLKYALHVFAPTWQYNVLGWNCEHLSRLIATDQPRCYQSRPIYWLCNLTPEGDHKTAQQLFQNYLNTIDPSLGQ
ncbi:hypothetical protein VB712_03430 [Spirulina sp. CCNP1310]|uniref:hypothetical protein n=1 Tax=Spirulina sp. CCNP1310 TaxID=3110249 RepID=UPI002B1ECA4A|nr:hypothetical protein [Spirulina sp. CCNP1310]MEA5418262.1 hypothetical protein [Spirulina sp. CCNP1310]